MTHKVVINGSYGGFDLSQTALVLLGELNGGMDMDEVQGKYLWANESGSNARSCPHLVRTVETLGDLANARDSTNLSVVVIEGTQYNIIEYDGAEYVQTPESMVWTSVPGEFPEPTVAAEELITLGEAFASVLNKARR